MYLGAEFVGGVDFGTGEPNEEPATHALCFMVVAINASFKMPFAHFFSSTINAEGIQYIFSIKIKKSFILKLFILNKYSIFRFI